MRIIAIVIEEDGRKSLKLHAEFEKNEVEVRVVCGDLRALSAEVIAVKKKCVEAVAS